MKKRIIFSNFPLFVCLFFPIRFPFFLPFVLFSTSTNPPTRQGCNPLFSRQESSLQRCRITSRVCTPRCSSVCCAPRWGRSWTCSTCRWAGSYPTWRESSSWCSPCPPPIMAPTRTPGSSTSACSACSRACPSARSSPSSSPSTSPLSSWRSPAPPSSSSPSPSAHTSPQEGPSSTLAVSLLQL